MGKIGRGFAIGAAPERMLGSLCELGHGPAIFLSLDKMVGQHRCHFMCLLSVSLIEALAEYPVETLTPCSRYLGVEDSLIECVDKAIRFGCGAIWPALRTMGAQP